MKVSLSLVILLFSAVFASCQTKYEPKAEMIGLPESHQRALGLFLEKNIGYSFKSAENFGKEDLPWFRKSFQKQHPYYQVADFNKDGNEDFAVIIWKNAFSKTDDDLADSHRELYELAVVVFHGSPDSDDIKPVYMLYLSDHPRVSFIDYQADRLVFGIVETDSIFSFKPTPDGRYEPSFDNSTD